MPVAVTAVYGTAWRFPPVTVKDKVCLGEIV